MGAKKILLVEDDDVFRSTISEVLGKKYQVIQAPNGKSACELMSVQDYDLVLSDIQMPNMSGIDLLEWSTKNRPMPFIIMTGFSTLLETKSAFELGAKGFIAKPFRINQLLDLIPTVMGEEQKKAPEKKPSDAYYKVSIEEFIAKPTIDFDIYIKLSETNFIKIANKSEQLPKEQIAKYRERGVKHFYIEKEDFGKLVQFNLGLVKIINTRSEIAVEKKTAFMNYTGKVILERTFTDGIDQESIQESSAFLKMAVDCATQSEEGFDLLSLLNSYSDAVYANSVAVSFCSVMLAKTLGVTSLQTLFKISMAGLFHDIGKKEIDSELLKKPRHLTTRAEQKEIESHVVRGHDILQGIKCLHSDVVRMAYEHHEDQAGLGYPNAKSARDQHPLSKILQAAVMFVDYTDTLRQSGQPVTAAAVIASLQQLYEKRIDPLCLAALKKIYNVKT
ncbi:MAG: response regulator [Pseudobdellovibrio sp.]|jgi:putative nucleotidyltransferase with HDIG domain|nr:response regulator [Pseudobdellovibrio sp.]